VIDPFVAYLRTGRGSVPFDILVGRTAERFGVTPEEIDAGDCYNIRVHELLNIADAASQENGG